MSDTIQVTSVGTEVEIVTQGISPFLPGTRGKVIEKPANAPEHDGLVRVEFDGGHDWYFHPTWLRPVPADAPQDHGPLAAVLSDRTLAKVLSRPAYVPRETPSLVELDRREAEWERIMSAAIEWEYADAYPDSPAAKDATAALDDLRGAVRAYRESEAARTTVQS